MWWLLINHQIKRILLMPDDWWFSLPSEISKHECKKKKRKYFSSYQKKLLSRYRSSTLIKKEDFCKDVLSHYRALFSLFIISFTLNQLLFIIFWESVAPFTTTLLPFFTSWERIWYLLWFFFESLLMILIIFSWWIWIHV